jgi:hypothetical protein
MVKDSGGEAASLLSSADPGRPMDCEMESRWQAALKYTAAYSFGCPRRCA